MSRVDSSLAENETIRGGMSITGLVTKISLRIGFLSPSSWAILCIYIIAPFLCQFHCIIESASAHILVEHEDFKARPEVDVLAAPFLPL